MDSTGRGTSVTRTDLLYPLPSRILCWGLGNLDKQKADSDKKQKMKLLPTAKGHLLINPQKFTWFKASGILSPFGQMAFPTDSQLETGKWTLATFKGKNVCISK